METKTERDKLREEMIQMLKDSRFNVSNADYTLKVLVYKEQSGDGPGDVRGEGEGNEDDGEKEGSDDKSEKEGSDDESVASDGVASDGDASDGDASDGDDESNGESDGKSPTPPTPQLQSHQIQLDITLKEVTQITYNELLEFELFKELCAIFKDKPENLYSKAHFEYYDKHYDAHCTKHGENNNKLLDIYEAVDTMMLGLPYEEVTEENLIANRGKA